MATPTGSPRPRRRRAHTRTTAPSPHTSTPSLSSVCSETRKKGPFTFARRFGGDGKCRVRNTDFFSRFFLLFRPSATALIGHPFFKQVCKTSVHSDSLYVVVFRIQSSFGRLLAALKSNILRFLVCRFLPFQIKRRPSEALPELLRPVSPITSFQSSQSQDSPSGMASLESDLSYLEVDDWDF